MKAAIYPGGGQPVVIENIADPRPGPDEVLIKVHRCGICGTDLSFTKGTMWDFGTHVQFGHEYAGEIVELGKNVDSYQVGERIAVLPSVACGQCSSCHSHGNNVLCQSSPGNAMVGFAEYAKVPVSVATRLPQVLSMADGALIEPLAISLYGVKMAAIQPGDRVLVLGAGTIALCAIYWARRHGAGNIVAMSRSPARAEMAKTMGADSFVTYGENEVAEAAEALGGPADVVLECVGVPGMLARAINHARLLGKVLSLGFCSQPDEVVPAVAGFKAVTLQFPVGYSVKDFTYVTRSMLSGHVDPKAMISSVVQLGELPDKFEQLLTKNDENKVQVACQT